MRRTVAIFIMIITFVGCSSTEFESIIPTDIASDYYISLAGGKMFIGQEITDVTAYTPDEAEIGRYIQALGLYDIKLEDNRVTEIRTASYEIKLSSILYVGQTKESLESYLSDTVKYQFSDRTVYYDVINKVCTEVNYDHDNKAKIIRFKSMQVKE